MLRSYLIISCSQRLKLIQTQRNTTQHTLHISSCLSGHHQWRKAKPLLHHVYLKGNVWPTVEMAFCWMEMRLTMSQTICASCVARSPSPASASLSPPSPPEPPLPSCLVWAVSLSDRMAMDPDRAPSSSWSNTFNVDCGWIDFGFDARMKNLIDNV